MQTLALASVICIVCACITALCKYRRVVLWLFAGEAFVTYAVITVTRLIAGLLEWPLAPWWLMIPVAFAGTAAMFYLTPDIPEHVTREDIYRSITFGR